MLTRSSTTRTKRRRSSSAISVARTNRQRNLSPDPTAAIRATRSGRSGSLRSSPSRQPARLFSMRICVTCGTELPLSDFGRNARCADGIHRTCKPCVNRHRRNTYRANRERELQKQHQYYKEHPNRRRATRIKHLYGIEYSEYERLRELQQGCCAVCGTAPDRDLHVDHCHTTGRVRGLLCGGCNRALGIMHDDPACIRRLALYAERHASLV